MPNHYPVVYIRGYAMKEPEVEETFNNPDYGFNLGAVQVRQGQNENPFMRIFESPVIRLMKDYDYEDSFGRFVDPQNEPIPNSVPNHRPKVDWRRTLWVFRYYDEESVMFGRDREEEDIEHYAKKLALFLNRVRLACGEPDGFKVNLVAHSMGGLITRCYLQYPELLDGTATAPVEVNKLFTFGSPHQGITFRRGLGWMADVRDFFGFRGSDAFGPKRMRKYLSLPDENEPLHTYHAVRGNLDRTKIFCVVGSNYQDYVVGSAKKTVGPASDGLVMMENAYVKGASRAYIHRSHSGPLGMVNSEEGYQNLIRFLFGDVRYELLLAPMRAKGHLPGIDDGELEYFLVDVDIVTRGLGCYIQSRREANLSAITVPMKNDHQVEQSPTHLFTGFLDSDKIRKGDRYIRSAVGLRIEPHYADPGFFGTSRYEGSAVLNDRLYVRIDRAKEKIGVHWGSPNNYETLNASKGTVTVPLPQAARRWLDCAGLEIRIQGWD